MNFIQGTLQVVEVGRGAVLARLLPLAAAVIVVAFWTDFQVFRGLDDEQSMDNAQLARQLVRGHGFTTEFLRPHAVAQLRDYAVSESLTNGRPRDLFPTDQFPPGTPRILPDTYNAPGYPFLLATWFYFLHPDFDEPLSAVQAGHGYSPERWILLLNQLLFVATGALVFALGLRLFDHRVAWLALVVFFSTDLIWKYSGTGQSTLFLMFILTAAFLCLLEVVCTGEGCFDSDERSFLPAWGWGLAAAVLLAVACLTRLSLIALLVPVVAILVLMPRSSVALTITVPVLVLALVAPWFIYMNNISGNPLGSSASLLLYGTGDYPDNEIFCTTAIPSYEQLFKDASKKEYSGFRWHFDHAWSLMGASPLILFFAVSALHQFRRRRTRLFHLLIFGSLPALIAINNLGDPAPVELGPWNIVILVFPCAIVIGGAFFFIMLDRLGLQLWLLNNIIITLVIVLAFAPLGLTLTTSFNYGYAFPPYVPPVIKQFAQFAEPDEWVTSDMPWATAWYGDRASLWLPDSLADFEAFHDNVCPTGVLMFTPVTWGMPIATVTTGEYKDWFPLMLVGQAPPNFPLLAHSATGPGGPSYSIWSDRPRWVPK